MLNLRHKKLSGLLLRSTVAFRIRLSLSTNQHLLAAGQATCDATPIQTRMLLLFFPQYLKSLHGKITPLSKGAFRDMDFVKRKLGVEVQFGKYAFMVYNVCAKMTIFHKLGHINAGIEIVPIKRFADHMSTGVSYFEQFVWDLQHRGVSNIDIPVLIIGIDA
ncbi:MAG: BglII/BstYI family type II restriction endonuclease [Verrucomicrobia bacterium]|nr:BglII/BstYI family type II restriction endonuclease [Verrucomicrobiota bacterium]